MRWNSAASLVFVRCFLILCTSGPICPTAEFRSYFEHVKGLRFDDRPDYDYLKRLFRELFFRKGFSYDNLFDWELLQTMGAGTTVGAGGGAAQGATVGNSGTRGTMGFALDTGELPVDEPEDGAGGVPRMLREDELAPEGDSRDMVVTPQSVQVHDSSRVYTGAIVSYVRGALFMHFFAWWGLYL